MINWQIHKLRFFEIFLIVIFIQRKEVFCGSLFILNTRARARARGYVDT